MPNRPRIVIVGAGFGGLTCVKALAREKATITLIDKQNHHLFQPLLYQVATAGLSPAEIAVPIRHILRSQKNVEIRMDEVVGVDLKQQMVKTKQTQQGFDYLVLATGSQYHYFGKDTWAPFAPSLKSIPDAIEIRRRVLTAFERAETEGNNATRTALLTFAIVGGGPTGVEMAGAVAELANRALAKDFRHINPSAAQILLLEGGPRILTSFPESLAQKAEQSLTKLGVKILNNTLVTSITPNEIRANDQSLPCRTVVWCAGVKSTPLGEWMEIPTDSIGRVEVDDQLRLKTAPNVFVIGDAAHVEDAKGEPLPGVAPVAMQQGRYVGKHIAKTLRGGTLGTPFQYKDKGNLATIGRSAAIADLNGFHISGFLGWLIWLVVHIFYLIGFRNRLLVLIQWAWSYVTFQRGARLITEEPPPSP